jgi:hypothetical protein
LLAAVGVPQTPGLGIDDLLSGVLVGLAVYVGLELF